MLWREVRVDVGSNYEKSRIDFDICLKTWQNWCQYRYVPSRGEEKMQAEFKAWTCLGTFRLGALGASNCRWDAGDRQASVLAAVWVNPDPLCSAMQATWREKGKAMCGWPFFALRCSAVIAAEPTSRVIIRRAATTFFFLLQRIETYAQVTRPGFSSQGIYLFSSEPRYESSNQSLIRCFS